LSPDRVPVACPYGQIQECYYRVPCGRACQPGQLWHAGARRTFGLVDAFKVLAKVGHNQVREW